MRSDTVAGLVLCAFVFVVVGGLASIHWYCSGLQSEVYKREGIEISQWECYWGVKPAEWSIHFRQEKGSKHDENNR